MAYIGRQPTAAALTASDITDGIVSTAKLTGNLVTPGTLDINGQNLILDADQDTTIHADTDDQIDFRVGGYDKAAITSTGMLINSDDNSVNLTLVSTDADANEGPKLLLRRTSSSPADDDVLGQIQFHGDDSAGQQEDLVILESLFADVTNGTEDATFRIKTKINGTHSTGLEFNPTHTIFDERKLSTGGETAPDVDPGGITIDLNANDDKFISFKSSDYSHGMTGQAETDTGFYIAKSQSGGGVSMTALNDGANENIWNLSSIMGETNTTVSNSSSGGNFTFHVSCKDGTGTQAVADAGNAWVMRNNNAAKFIIKGDGEMHSDTGTATFDEYDDAQLARAFDLSHGRGVIESKFDKFIAYNHEKLADLGLVGRENDGTPNHFTNITGMQKLHNGAIWQQYTKHNQLLEAVYDLAKEAVGEEKANTILEKHDIKLLKQ